MYSGRKTTRFSSRSLLFACRLCVWNVLALRALSAGLFCPTREWKRAEKMCIEIKQKWTFPATDQHSKTKTSFTSIFHFLICYEVQRIECGFFLSIFGLNFFLSLLSSLRIIDWFVKCIWGRKIQIDCEIVGNHLI